jgi:hypothetical protein
MVEGITLHKTFNHCFGGGFFVSVHKNGGFLGQEVKNKLAGQK